MRKEWMSRQVIPMETRCRGKMPTQGVIPIPHRPQLRTVDPMGPRSRRVTNAKRTALLSRHFRHPQRHHGEPTPSMLPKNLRHDHLLTHPPMLPSCPICASYKIKWKPCYRQHPPVVGRYTTVGEMITMDYMESRKGNSWVEGEWGPPDHLRSRHQFCKEGFLQRTGRLHPLHNPSRPSLAVCASIVGAQAAQRSSQPHLSHGRYHATTPSQDGHTRME